MAVADEGTERALRIMEKELEDEIRKREAKPN